MVMSHALMETGTVLTATPTASQVFNWQVVLPHDANGMESGQVPDQFVYEGRNDHNDSPFRDVTTDAEFITYTYILFSSCHSFVKQCSLLM